MLTGMLASRSNSITIFFMAQRRLCFAGLHIGNPAASTCGDWEGRLTGNLADAVR
jgi:hypothetical protein